MIAQKSHKSKCCGDISGGEDRKGKNFIVITQSNLVVSYTISCMRHSDIIIYYGRLQQAENFTVEKLDIGLIYLSTRSLVNRLV